MQRIDSGYLEWWYAVLEIWDFRMVPGFVGIEGGKGDADFRDVRVLFV